MNNPIHTTLAPSILAIAAILAVGCAATPTPSSALSPSADDERLIVKDDYSAAREAAIRRERPLLVNSTAHTSSNGRMMEVTIFGDPAVATSLASFVEARLHADAVDPKARRANQDVIDDLVQEAATPVYVAVNPVTGEVLGRWSGAALVQKAEFAGFLDDMNAAFVSGSR